MCGAAPMRASRNLPVKTMQEKLGKYLPMADDTAFTNTGSALHGGTQLFQDSVEFAVRSQYASKLELCLFDETGNKEIARLAMERGDDDVHRLFVDGVKPGARYGYRAHGVYAPDHGLWFDPTKLLVDPYATVLDRPFSNHPSMFTFGLETAFVTPKSVVTRHKPVTLDKPRFNKGGFIYEIAVKPFTMLHPDVPEHQRGTIAALAHPSVVAHLKHIGVDAIELMPITAWIDERHLPPLGLTNGWGYNPVAFMALDPRLAPGGVIELRDTVAALHTQDIGVILDLVFNHTGESDRHGTTLSLRGLDNLNYYRHAEDNPGVLVNDTGTGNTVACDSEPVRRLIVDSLRHFVQHAGIDGFRFDLAPVLGRSATGFERQSLTLAAIHNDPLLKDRILIAEPWDIGPDGYQLGNFPDAYLEWNDRARDDLRRYWRGDQWTTGALADALAGSSGIFSRHSGTETRSVNFLAAHDGFTLMDIVSYAGKHNERNGEENRDGHNENHSWNNGAEGSTDDSEILKRRAADVKAMLSTLFVTHGTIMLTAGDEGGRSQQGNNNAYAQDNELTWLDWRVMNSELVAHTAFLSSVRKRFAVFSSTDFFTGRDQDVEWLNPEGVTMSVADWERAEGTPFSMLLKTKDLNTGKSTRLAVLFNRRYEPQNFILPGRVWKSVGGDAEEGSATVPARSVGFYHQP